MARGRRTVDATALARDYELGDWVEAVSPEYDRPAHLGRMVEVMAAAPHGGMRVVVAAPVQHGKTTVCTHGIAWMVARESSLRCVYASNAYAFAARQSRVMRVLAARGGAVVGEQDTIAEWVLDGGGGLLATGVGGQLTGHAGDVVVVDDPYKNMEQAESADYRDMVSQWRKSVVMTRLHPGSSVIWVASRWHDDDESGRLLREGWDDVCLPAIGDEGAALWPEERPLEFLEQQRAALGEYLFWALYMGKPRPRVGAVFGPARMGAVEGFDRVAIGVDLAYSHGACSDYVAAVVLGEKSGQYHVIDCYRAQTGITEAESALRFFVGAYPGAEIVSYVAAAERGAIDLLNERGLVIYPMPARYNKFVRAQRCAAKWNAGGITVATRGTWLDAFVREVTNFTGGPGDTHDDQVDALVSAYDWMEGGKVELPGGSFTAGMRVM